MSLLPKTLSDTGACAGTSRNERETIDAYCRRALIKMPRVCHFLARPSVSSFVGGKRSLGNLHQHATVACSASALNATNEQSVAIVDIRTLPPNSRSPPARYPRSIVFTTFTRLLRRSVQPRFRAHRRCQHIAEEQPTGGPAQRLSVRSIVITVLWSGRCRYLQYVEHPFLCYCFRRLGVITVDHDSRFRLGL